jgi:membrane protein DedA with SNARE-associated domain
VTGELAVTLLTLALAMMLGAGYGFSVGQRYEQGRTCTCVEGR